MWMTNVSKIFCKGKYFLKIDLIVISDLDYINNFILKFHIFK